MCEVGGFVVVLPTHLEILKGKVQSMLFSCYRIEPIQSSILEGHLMSVRLLQLAKFVHHRRHEILIFSLCSQYYSFFFWSYGFGRNWFFERTVVCFRQWIEVRVVVCTQLKGRLIAVAFDFFRLDYSFIGCEKFLKSCSILVGVHVGILKLMNVADSREIFFIVGKVGLKGSHAFEHSSVRFINLHKLQYNNRINRFQAISLSFAKKWT